MKKYTDYYPFIFVAIFLILSLFLDAVVKNNIFTVLFSVFFILIPFYFLFKYNGKLYYLYSKSTGSGGPRVLSFFLLFFMFFTYFFAFLVFAFRSIFNPMHIPILFLLIFILLLPGVYIASQKNFLVFFNKRMNNLILRFIFIAPGSFVFSAVFSLISYAIVLVFFSILGLRNTFDGMTTDLSIFFAVFGNLLTIFYFKKFIFKNDLPPEYQEIFESHELYIFMPLHRSINDSTFYNISDDFKIGRVRVQVRDLEISSKKLTDKIHFTRYGALIAGSDVFRIFEENNLTGYKTRKIIDKKTKNGSTSYFQLISTSEMPSVSAQTKIKKGLISGLLLKDDIIYYNKNILNRIEDINKTFEYVGTDDGMPYYHQKLWVVSKKAMEIFINQLGQEKRDFIPVNLVDNE